MLRKPEKNAARDVLWEWVLRDADEAQGAIRALAKNFSGFFAAMLRGRKLPFWLIVPALKALNMTPAALGQPAYSKRVIAAGEADVGALGRLVKGELEPARRAMARRKSGLAPFAGLLLRHVSAMQPAARALAVALMRTWGYDVKHRGKVVTLGQPQTFPLTLRSRLVPGKQKRLEIVEEATKPTMLCVQTVRRVRVTGKGVTLALTDEAMDAFDADQSPSGCRVVKGVVWRRVIELAPVLAEVRESGLLQIEVDLLHPQGGAEHGLDGWTGRVFAPPVPIIHDPPQAKISLSDHSLDEEPLPVTPGRAGKGCSCGAAPGPRGSPGTGPALWLLLLLLLGLRLRHLRRRDLQDRAGGGHAGA